VRGAVLSEGRVAGRRVDNVDGGGVADHDGRGASRHGVVRLHEVSELLETQSVVAVRVEPADNLHELLLEGVNAVAAEERSQVAHGDKAVRVLVNRVEGVVRRVVMSGLQLVLEVLHVVLQGELLLEDRENRVLDVTRQVVEAAAAHCVPVERDVAEAVVLARQQHLHEVLEVECAIIVAVEEANQEVEFGLVARVRVVVAQEVQQVHRDNAARRIAVHALEGRVGREVLDVAETLAQVFEFAFALADRQHQVFESVLRFKCQH